MRGRRGLVAAPAPLRPVRTHRLLRRFTQQARQQACERDRTPGDPELRTGRRLVLRLSQPRGLRRSHVGAAAPSSRGPACTRSAGTRATPVAALAELSFCPHPVWITGSRSTRMKAIVLDGFGDADVLRLADVPDPEPRDDDLLVRNHATGINRADIIQRNGGYKGDSFGDSDIMGLEIAGEVIGMGKNVRGFSPGDRVMGIVGGGAYAELARIDRRMAMPIPANIDYVQAAAIPEVFVTAHEAAFHLGRLQAGESILVHAGASGVGSAAVQLAHTAGARVFATASGSKLDKVRSFGADVTIDHRAEDFAEVIARETAGKGVDVIIDFIGAAYFERNLASLNYGGRLVVVGLLGGSDAAKLPMDRLLFRHPPI